MHLDLGTADVKTSGIRMLRRQIGPCEHRKLGVSMHPYAFGAMKPVRRSIESDAGKHTGELLTLL